MPLGVGHAQVYLACFWLSALPGHNIILIHLLTRLLSLAAGWPTPTLTSLHQLPLSLALNPVFPPQTPAHRHSGAPPPAPSASRHWLHGSCACSTSAPSAPPPSALPTPSSCSSATRHPSCRRRCGVRHPAPSPQSPCPSAQAPPVAQHPQRLVQLPPRPPPLRQRAAPEPLPAVARGMGRLRQRCNRVRVLSRLLPALCRPWGRVGCMATCLPSLR